MNQAKHIRIVTIQVPLARNFEAIETALSVGVLGLASVHHAASLALAANYDDAYDLLRATQRMFSRAAHTDEQQEEHSVWNTNVAELLREILQLQKQEQEAKNKTISEKKLSDSAVKTFHDALNMNSVQFMAGARKREAVARRKKHLL